jgi:NAD(P)-dependent dehydrogenase (short-subunit alcohol dehydrogenase family)
MINRFVNKVAVVVGATSGMGEASAYRLAEEGAALLIVGRREQKGLRVVKNIEDNSGKASFFKADISELEDCKKIIDGAIERYGKIDALINIAGISISKGIEELTIQDWDYEINSNLKSYYLLCKYAVPFLKKTRGNIVNMASMVGLVGKANHCSYSASKGGIISMSKSMALDLAKYGIRVNIICPGWIRSEMNENWFQQKGDKEQGIRDQINKMHPFGRIGEPEEVASVIAFLASEDASFITGVAMPIEGGLTLGYI